MTQRTADFRDAGKQLLAGRYTYNAGQRVRRTVGGQPSTNIATALDREQ